MIDDADFQATRPVSDRNFFDVARLHRWMTLHVEDYRAPSTVSQFRGGQSSPTYLIETPSRAYVMRRKPPGRLLPSAHAVDREIRAKCEVYKVST